MVGSCYQYVRPPVLILVAALGCGACVASPSGGGGPTAAAEQPSTRPSGPASPVTPVLASSPRPAAPPATATPRRSEDVDPREDPSYREPIRSPVGRAEVVTNPGRAEVLLAVASPVSRGQSVLVTARTTVAAECSVLVSDPSGPVASAGLVSKYADGSGNVSWSWTVAPDAPLGSWAVDVVCGTPSGLRGFARAPLTVR